MKKIILLISIIAGSALNAQAAGHGSIRETETQIYVEYSDEAVQDKPEVIHHQPDSTVQPPLADGQKKEEETLLNQRRRQKYESRAAEWTEQRQDMERRQMENNNGVSEDN